MNMRLTGDEGDADCSRAAFSRDELMDIEVDGAGGLDGDRAGSAGGG